MLEDEHHAQRVELAVLKQQRARAKSDLESVREDMLPPIIVQFSLSHYTSA